MLDQYRVGLVALYEWALIESHQSQSPINNIITKCGLDRDIIIHICLRTVVPAVLMVTSNEYTSQKPVRETLLGEYRRAVNEIITAHRTCGPLPYKVLTTFLLRKGKRYRAVPALQNDSAATLDMERGAIKSSSSWSAWTWTYSLSRLLLQMAMEPFYRFN